MRRRIAIPIMIVAGVSLSACTTAGETAPGSQTPVEIVATSEYSPDNSGGAVSWTVTGGVGRIPDDASVLVSIARAGAEVVTPSTESSDVTDGLLERVGESPDEAQVIVRSGTTNGEIAFSLGTESENGTDEIPRIHIGLIDNASGDAVAVRSVPVAMIDLGAPGS